ncbi:MAG: hypothetical protein GEEBNDBF_00428 [bacterium]|nr:hypothetical protein [bacterium]
MSKLWLLLSVLMLSIFSGIPGPISSAEASPPFCCWKLLKEDVASQLCIYDCPQEGYPENLWIPEIKLMARAVNGDIPSRQQILFDGIFFHEILDSIDTFTADRGHRPRSLTVLFDSYPLFYHPIRSDQTDWPIIDGATGESAPPGSFILVLDQEALGIQFTVGEPGTVSKSYRQKLEKQLTGVPSLSTEMATFAVVQRIKDFGQLMGRLPESHAELLQQLHLRANRMQPQPGLLAPSQFGIEVWINTEHNLIRVSERDQSGWSPERLFTITFDPAVGSLRSTGEILKPGDPRLSTEGYQLFLVSQVN